jgi:cell division septum initiation protein DivIVA
MQKEKAVLDEKLYHADSKREEVKAKLEQEVESLKEQLANATAQVSKDREIFISENERLKTLLLDMEKEYSEVQSLYERDKALWEGKF